MSKLVKKSALTARNAFVAVLSILLLFAEYNGVTLGMDAEGAISLIENTSGANLVLVILMNFGTFITKAITLIASGDFTLSGIFKSGNAVTQIITIAAGLLSAFIGVDAASIVSLVTHIVNFVKHVLDEPKFVAAQ